MTKRKGATTCDLDFTQGSEKTLSLEITVETTSIRERNRVKQAIEKAITDCGYDVDQIPIL